MLQIALTDSDCTTSYPRQAPRVLFRTSAVWHPEWTILLMKQALVKQESRQDQSGKSESVISHLYYTIRVRSQRGSKSKALSELVSQLALMT